MDVETLISSIWTFSNSISLELTKGLVNAKEIELLKVQIEEIKVSTSNPLTTN